MSAIHNFLIQDDAPTPESMTGQDVYKLLARTIEECTDFTPGYGVYVEPDFSAKIVGHVVAFQ